MSLQDRKGAAHVAAVPRATERKPGLALLVIATAQLMLVLDNTIVNVALPSMQRGLHIATANLNWVISAYALTYGGLLLAGGRAGDLFGRRRVFRFGLVVFTVASLAGGLAPTGTALIAARVLQGAGAAIAAPTALSLLVTTFEAGQARNKALGVYGAMGGLGSVVGLLLGGALTGYVSWRWVLFVNAPIAALVLAGTDVLIEGDREHGALDVPGALTATLGMASLIYAINRGNIGGWTDPLTIAFFAVGLALLATFLLIERRGREPMMPPRVVRDRNRGGANAVLFLLGVGTFAMFFFLTLYMQVVRGFSAMHTGLAYLPYVVGIAAAAGAIGPKLLNALPARAVVASGMVFASGGLSWYALLLTPVSNYYLVILPAMLVTGFGAGLTLVSCTMVGMRGVSPRDTGIAAGVINTISELGGALGLAALAAVASTVTRAKLHSAGTAAGLTDGYVTGFLIGAAICLAGAIVAALAITTRVSGTETPAH